MRVERDYDVAPQALVNVLTDETFLAARSSRFGGSGAPTVQRSGDSVIVTVPRTLPVDAVPGPFRGMIGNGDLIQTDTWPAVLDDRVLGTWTADVGGAPVDLQGTHQITPTPDGCRYEVTAKVKVRIPFIGGQAEGLIRDRLAGLVAAEQEFAADWLARDGRA